MAEPTGPVPDPPHFGDLEAFVATYLVKVCVRDVSGRSHIWCPRWWAHAEAVARLDALWQAWESLRHDPHLGMSSWWRDHVDPHMAVLMDPDGPFKGCSAEKGHRSRELPDLPLEPPPPGTL